VLPKRVLDIGPSDGSVIKLYETVSGEIGKYAALSHCWGKSSIPTTCQENFHNRLSSIKWDDLTKVFQDAITVARMFEIPYLWIDSLCIIQDSGPDWDTESFKMGSYYSNAYVTISSASAPDGGHRFLADRETEFLPTKFRLDEYRPDSPTVYTRLVPGQTEKRSDLFGQISTRAWCWQENVLSTRVMHFLPSELIWECKGELLSECGYRPQNIYAMNLINSLDNIEADPMAKWHSLIQAYSQRNITKEKDRLPAVSAVAKYVSGHIRSEYAAGLWASDLPRQLLWETPMQRSSDDLRPLPFENKYPSWSWASVSGALRLGSATFNGSVKPSSRNIDTSYRALVPVAQVQKFSCQPPPENPFGQVDGGYIVVSGEVAHARIECKDPLIADSYTLKVPAMRKDKDDFSADCILESFQFTDPLTGLMTESVRRSRAQKDEKDEKKVQRTGFSGSVYLLIVCLTRMPNGGTYSFDGLVLGACEEENTYTRIGFFSRAGREFPWRVQRKVIKIV